NEGVIAEPFLEPAREMCPLRAHVGEQTVAAYHPLDRQSRSASERVPHIGVAVLECARALGDGVENFVPHHERPDRRVAATEAFCERHQIGAHALLLAGMQRARAAHAAHHLVENEQHAVAVATFAHAPKIPGHGGDRAQGGADDGSGDKGDDVLATELLDLVFELSRQPLAVTLRGLVRAALAIFVNRRHMMRFDQKRSELLALPLSAPDREPTEGDAVIALASRDDVSPLRLAAFDEILAREFERGLERLRAAADEKDVAGALRGVSDEIVGQCLRNLRREEARMRICKPVELLAHRCQDIRMRMAQTGHRRAARGVDVFLPYGVLDGDALAARGNGIGMTGLAVEDMSDDRSWLFLTCLKTRSKPLTVPQQFRTASLR